jgi:hypothetical protein
MNMGAKLLTVSPKKVYKLAAKGLNKGMICKGLGISYPTLDRMLNDNIEIFEALKEGTDAAIQQVEDSLFNQAISEKSVVASIFYLKNKAPDRYKDTHDVNHTGDLKISVGTMSAPKDIN